jgi:hypothetical protein
MLAGSQPARNKTNLITSDAITLFRDPKFIQFQCPGSQDRSNAAQRYALSWKVSCRNRLALFCDSRDHQGF